MEGALKRRKEYMKNTYKISFEQIRLKHHIGGMLEALERGIRKFGIDFYLVGAVSRDIWMSGIYKIASRRITRDIDFAIFINDKGVYEDLKNYLIKNEGFAAYSGNAFVLIWKDRIEVDLLPFGAIEDENRRVTVNGTGYTTMHVEGFREVYEHQLAEVSLDEQHFFKICTLPGIVLLKLIAWDDRPEFRRNDIKDVSDILNHFFEMYQGVIWEEHYDLFDGDKEPELLAISARVMGREMRKIAKRNVRLEKRILNILVIQASEINTSRIALIMREYFDNTLEECFLILKEIKSGFED
jgi:predicted nucleotidyltransferase